MTTLSLCLCVGLLFAVRPHRALAAGASLKISPSGGTYEVGALVDISFALDTGSEAVNAVKADVQFPPDKLQVVNPAASTSFISIWVTAPTYSNTDGTLSFQGGLPSPGIKTSSGIISTVTFRVKGSGKATLKYLPTSKVLRNDGEGTNILTSTTSAEFALKNPPPSGPVVSSPTHADANQWYGSREVQLTWEPVDGAVGYSYAFDQNAKKDPDETVDTTNTSALVKATADGVWYFHVRAKSDILGGTTTYAVQIDGTPPAGFTPELDRPLVTTEETATLRFITTDAASGLDHYEVRQIIKNNGNPSANTLFVEASSPYVVPKLEAGQYTFVVRALDRAGNSSEGTVDLNVVAGGVPFYARVPILRNPAVANGALIALSVLVVASTGAIIIRRVRIRSAFRHDLEALERDAQRKSAALQRELDELREAQQLVQQDVPPVAPPSTGPPGAPPQPPTA